MAKTTYRTWTDTELVTAAMLNQQIRDNGNEIWKGTTAGDLDYYTAATTKSRLGIGSAGDLLTVVSGAPAWQGYVGACVSDNGGSRNISNNSVTTIGSLGTAGAYDADPWSMLSGGNTLTIPTGQTGIWTVVANGYFDGHGGDGPYTVDTHGTYEIGNTLRQMALNIAGVVRAGQSGNQASNASDMPSVWLNVTWTGKLTAGATIQLQVLQVSTATLAFHNAYLSAMRIR